MCYAVCVCEREYGGGNLQTVHDFIDAIAIWNFVRDGINLIIGLCAYWDVNKICIVNKKHRFEYLEPSAEVDVSWLQRLNKRRWYEQDSYPFKCMSVSGYNDLFK